MTITKQASSFLALAVLGGTLLAGCGGGGGTAPADMLTGQVFLPSASRQPDSGLVPIPGATVTAIDFTTDTEVGSAVTDDQGRYRIDGLPQGRYLLQVTHVREGRTYRLAAIADLVGTRVPDADLDPETTVALEVLQAMLDQLGLMHGLSPDAIERAFEMYLELLEEVREAVEEDSENRADCSDEEDIDRKRDFIRDRNQGYGPYLGTATAAGSDPVPMALFLDRDDSEVLVVRVTDEWVAAGTGDPDEFELRELVFEGSINSEGTIYIGEDDLKVFGVILGDYGTGQFIDRRDPENIKTGTWEVRRATEPNSGLWFGPAVREGAPLEEKLWVLMLVPDAGQTTMLAATVEDFRGITPNPLVSRFNFNGTQSELSHTLTHLGQQITAVGTIAEPGPLDRFTGTITSPAGSYVWAMSDDIERIEDQIDILEEDIEDGF